MERIRGKKRRPSPENSRNLRKERGRIGEVRVWRVRERCLSKVVRRVRRDGWGCWGCGPIGVSGGRGGKGGCYFC